MELWIRSQDRSNLKKVNNIYVEKITKDYDSWVGNIHSRPYVITSDNGNLGFYATEERALEVLNEIQVGIIYCGLSFEEMNQALKEKNIRVKANLLFNIRANTCLYEMPEE